MHSFIVVCLAVAACADNLGYKYRPVGHSDAGLSFAPSSGNSGDGSSSNFAPSLAPQGAFYSATNEAPSYTPATEFEKEFYTYTANEDDFNYPAESTKYENSVQQGLQVVFIKGPENDGLENAATALAKHAAEQKAHIYVLQKQTDIGNLANKLNIVNINNNNKPEVHFVKYRTSEDAVNAQKAIQDQYDSLGGRSQSHNGGVAPALNFASSAPAPIISHESAASAPASNYKTEASAPSSYVSPNPTAGEPNNAYLPASILHLFRL